MEAVNGLAASVRGWLRRRGFDVVRYGSDSRKMALPADFDSKAIETIQCVSAYTMTSAERLFSLIQAIRYVSSASIPGEIVECGVWRGGSMMAAARTLIECDDARRKLYLFDTFDGMSAPSAKDVGIDGQAASDLLRTEDRNNPNSAWCYASLEDVRGSMAGVGYEPARVHFVKGKVEDTIPGGAPERIAVLRLDTDWYESTRHELEHLYPRLSPGGVLIIDDYGHWAGCRQAVDEYFSSRKLHVLLNRVDYTGRIAVKPG